MTKDLFYRLIKDRILILDGATGSNLMEKGMKIGECPEKWIIDNPEKLIELQTSFIEAGSNIIYAPTFTSNRIKLSEYGLEDKVYEINKSLVEISKKAITNCNNRGYVAGDMTMTGMQMQPVGNMSFEELIDVYKEQCNALVDAGVDLFVVETMMSLAETRACILAIKETCDLPIMATLTFNEDGKTLFGSTPESTIVTLQSIGVDAVGVNCSTGPIEMKDIVHRMKKYQKVPIIVKPNAGIPQLVGGKTIFPMEPIEFAKSVRELVDIGADIVGGCCGTTPEHIKALASVVNGIKPSFSEPSKKYLLSSERDILEIDINGPFKVIGERINPTGKKAFQASLIKGNLDIAIDMAVEQEKAGASILDINMGMNGIDEKEMMVKCIYELMGLTDLPFSIDSSYIEVIESALRIYPGRCLINSISLEKSKCRKLFRIAKKYGAMCILLPLSDKGLPESFEEKIKLINELVNIALEEGLSKEDLVIDGLVTTVGANKLAAKETLETIEYCKNILEIPTVCGLSNISFGLPERINVNTAFLTMAISKGLTMAIANPCQSLLMNAAYASDLLLNKDDSDLKYINNVVKISTNDAKINVDTVNKESLSESGSIIYNYIIKGNKRNILNEVLIALNNGQTPNEILNNDLIPAINKVGELFENKKYFLPQLIASAQTMDIAIEHITPMLLKDKRVTDKATIIMATVEGDIHDIGKNLVCLMLKNYGYKVIDLGKDVPAKIIIEEAINNNASVIGLSALMTTTMVNMKEVVDLAKINNVKAKIIIGGACITKHYAKEINADGYSKDATEAVKLVESLLK